MNIKDFENQTGIFPDALIFEAAKHEHDTAEIEWGSMAGFYHDFKFNTDGLAKKCQKIANERWIKANEEISRLRSEITPLADQCEKLRAENNRLEDENENLRNEIGALHDRVDELSDEISELPTATLEVTEPEITIQTIRAAIQQAYQDAAHDDCKGDQILHMVWGFEYLLQRLGAE